MKEPLKKQSDKIGLSPGSLVYIGQKKAKSIKIRVIDYNEEHLEGKTVKNIEETFPYKTAPTITWINIDGLHDIEILKKLSEKFNIHLLTLEDILNTRQRPKIELYDDYIFVVLKMVRYKNKKLDVEQVSLIWGKNYLITFQEKEGDLFDPVRKRLKNTAGRIRKNAADYLAYALIDLIIDHYFLILDKLSEEIEHLEENILNNPDQTLVKNIHFLKRTLIRLRKSIYPMREVVNVLYQGETPLIKKSTRRFTKDLYDHIILINDSIETYREMVTSALDLYLSTMSMKMNEIMKVLTIIATIFIPLSFLAGVYGMNFNTDVSPFNMPELSFPYGYIFFWILTICIGGGFLLFFKRKKWL